MHSRVNDFIYELCKQIISTMMGVIVMFLFLHIHSHVNFIDAYLLLPNCEEICCFRSRRFGKLPHRRRLSDTGILS